jgi:hypothetical protein
VPPNRWHWRKSGHRRFIITGNQAKDMVVRAIGPSLAQFGLAGVLANPALEIHDQTGAIIASNNDWRSSQSAEIEASGLAPTNDAEAAIRLTLAPGSLHRGHAR